MASEPAILGIERAFASAWPALETVRAGAWEARLSRGFTKRANCIQSYDADDDGDASSRLPALAARYRAHGLDPLFRVTPRMGRADYSLLVGRGWRGEGASLVLTRAVAAPPPPVSVSIVRTALDDPDWLAGQAALEGFDAERAEVFAQICGNVGDPALGLSIADAGRVVASAMVVVVKSIAVLVNLRTESSVRRRGHGTALVAAGLGWAHENGARHAALQVEAGNTAAIALYRKLGFAFRYPYHYRRAPEASQ